MLLEPCTCPTTSGTLPEHPTSGTFLEPYTWPAPTTTRNLKLKPYTKFYTNTLTYNTYLVFRFGLALFSLVFSCFAGPFRCTYFEGPCSDPLQTRNRPASSALPRAPPSGVVRTAATPAARESGAAKPATQVPPVGRKWFG